MTHLRGNEENIAAVADGPAAHAELVKIMAADDKTWRELTAAFESYDQMMRVLLQKLLDVADENRFVKENMGLQVKMEALQQRADLLPPYAPAIRELLAAKDDQCRELEARIEAAAVEQADLVERSFRDILRVEGPRFVGSYMQPIGE